MFKVKLPTNLSALVVVDGSFPVDNIKGALESLSADEQYAICGVVYIASGEMISLPGTEPWSSPTIYPQENEALSGTLKRALEVCKPQIVVDLTSSPQTDWRQRMELAATSLFLGYPYGGPDYLLSPPEFEDVCQKPSLSIIALGRQAGRSSLAIYTAGLLKNRGINPAVITMSRGGPSFPEICHGEWEEITAKKLLALADSGRRSCASHLEIALFARVTTISCRRSGEGVCGVPFKSIAVDGALLANDLPTDFFIFVGSGMSIPPVRCDCTILLIPANLPLEDLLSYFGRYHILIADLICITHSGDVSRNTLSRLTQTVRSIKEDADIIKVVMEPNPLGEVTGKDIFLAANAPEKTLSRYREILRTIYKCKVVAASSNLCHREALTQDIQKALRAKRKPQVLLTELQGFAIDVAARLFLDAGLEVIYFNNQPRQMGKRDRLPQKLLTLAQSSISSYRKRSSSD
jgi:cyclic 2,3-diphosphoglycerate synthetase